MAGIPNPNNIFEWKFTIIGAKDSSYRGGLFFHKVIFPENFPNSAPEVCFINQIVNANHMSNLFYPLVHISISTLNCFQPNRTMREIFFDISVFINYLGNPDE